MGRRGRRRHRGRGTDLRGQRPGVRALLRARGGRDGGPEPNRRRRPDHQHRRRNYEGVSLYDYYYNHAGALPANKTNQEVKFTDSGRTVYGGGGITPDEKIEQPKANHFQETLLYKEAFFHFAPIYLANRTVDKNFQVDEPVLSEFKKYLTDQSIPWTQADLDGVSDWLKESIKSSIDTIQFGESTGLRVRADWDPEIQKALSYLPEAQALEDNAHKVLTQKAEARSDSGVQGAAVQKQ